MAFERAESISNGSGLVAALAALAMALTLRAPLAPLAPAAQEEAIEISLQAGEEAPEIADAPEPLLEPAAPAAQAIVKPDFEAAPSPTPAPLIAAPKRPRVKPEPDRHARERELAREERRRERAEEARRERLAEKKRAETEAARKQKIGHGGRAARSPAREGRREAPDRGGTARENAQARAGSANGGAYRACLQSASYPAAAVRMGSPSCTVSVSGGHLAGGCGNPLLDSAARSAVARCTSMYGPSSGVIHLHR